MIDVKFVWINRLLVKLLENENEFNNVQGVNAEFTNAGIGIDIFHVDDSGDFSLNERQSRAFTHSILLSMHGSAVDINACFT
ncbi:hypothetical protein ASD21_22550 [Caulobacter sp. Root1455]|nr:hypothetical protein ASD21_22550 [Caulobacter sp. Root1455]